MSIPNYKSGYADCRCGSEKRILKRKSVSASRRYWKAEQQASNNYENSKAYHKYLAAAQPIKICKELAHIPNTAS